MSTAALAAAIRSGLLGASDTAAIIVDFDRLDQRLASLRSAFPPDTLHAVAVKTNPLTPVLHHLVRRGFGLEAASFEELNRAADAGTDPSDMVFDSPVKTRHEIQRCDRRWPGMVVNANTLAELDRYPLGSRVRLGLRINPMVAVETDRRYDVSTPTSKFGVRIDRIDDIVRAVLDAPIVGLHVHSGSQIADARANVEVVRSLVTLASTIDDARSRAGVRSRIEYLDIGGGMAVQVGNAAWRPSAAPSVVTGHRTLPAHHGVRAVGPCAGRHGVQPGRVRRRPRRRPGASLRARGRRSLRSGGIRCAAFLPIHRP